MHAPEAVYPHDIAVKFALAGRILTGRIALHERLYRCRKGGEFKALGGPFKDLAAGGAKHRFGQDRGEDDHAQHGKGFHPLVRDDPVVDMDHRHGHGQRQEIRAKRRKDHRRRTPGRDQDRICPQLTASTAWFLSTYGTARKKRLTRACGCVRSEADSLDSVKSMVPPSSKVITPVASVESSMESRV